MLSQEQRATMSALWLERWRGWQGCGISMAEYARREGFDADAAYRWQRVLRRTGQWPETGGRPEVKKKRKAPVRFARVAVKEARIEAASMVVRVVLANGRRAEFEIGAITDLGEVLGVLERAA